MTYTACSGSPHTVNMPDIMLKWNERYRKTSVRADEVTGESEDYSSHGLTNHIIHDMLQYQKVFVM